MAKVLLGNVRPDIEYLKTIFAPAGYGIGEDTRQYITYDQIDNTFTSGLYWVDCTGNMVDGSVFNYALLRVGGVGSNHCIQELFPIGFDMVLIRRCYNGAWPNGWGKITWENSTTIIEGY